MCTSGVPHDFPSFSEGLSLRATDDDEDPDTLVAFPFLFGGTFIEGNERGTSERVPIAISLPFRRDFH